MVTLNGVTFTYGEEKRVLRDFNLSIPEGGRVCLMGVSGEGKTTVLRLVLGLERPARGTVSLPENTRFAAVFQEDRLLPWLTALENAALFSGAETAQAMLEALGLGDDLHTRPAALSGGMKRRVALARALCAPFDVLVLDEPLTGLDGETKARCLAAIDRAAQGKTLLLATHDKGEAAALDAEILELKTQQ